MFANSYYCSISSEGKFLEFSPSWMEFLGFNQVELLSKNIKDFIAQDQLENLKKTLDQSVQLRFPKEVEIKVNGPNKESKNFYFSVLYLSRESRFLMIGDDMSSLEELTRRQKSASQIYKETYRMCYWEYDLKTKHFYANLHNRLLDEKKEVEDVISFFQDLYHDSDAELLKSQLLKIINSTKEVVFVVQGKMPKEFFEITIKKNSDLNIISGFLRDVSDEVAKEKHYLDKNTELSSFEKGLDQFTIVARTDAKGRITYANDAFCKISKYEMGELLGRDHRILNSGHHPKEFFQKMWNCIKQGQSWRECIKNKAKDGTYYWVDTIIVPIMNSGGELVEILSFRYEVTKYQEVLEENSRLKQLLESKNQHL